MAWSQFKAYFSNFSLEKVVPSVVVLAVGLVVVKLLLKFFDTAMRHSKLEKTAYALLRSCVKFLLLFVLILILCGMLGVDVTSLVALLSVVSLAVSLSVQNALANVVSGFILLGTSPYKVGDFVQIGQQSGTVQELGMFYTKITTVDNRQVNIPNSNITANDIVNYTVLGQRRVDLSITASYNAEPARVREALLAAANQPTSLFTPEPKAFVNQYGDSAIEYILQVWTTSEHYWETYIAVTEAVYTEFKARDIEMTYPHVNVHFDQKISPAKSEV